MDERYANDANAKYRYLTANTAPIDLTGNTAPIDPVYTAPIDPVSSTNSPPAAPLLRMIGSELVTNVKELHELVAQARGIADSILGAQPEPGPGDPKEANGASGSFGAMSMAVAALRHVTHSLREQLNRLAAL